LMLCTMPQRSAAPASNSVSAQHQASAMDRSAPVAKLTMSM
jgi:hypothetical protein